MVCIGSPAKRRLDVGHYPNSSANREGTHFKATTQFGHTIGRPPIGLPVPLAIPICNDVVFRVGMASSTGARLG